MNKYTLLFPVLSVTLAMVSWSIDRLCSKSAASDITKKKSNEGITIKNIRSTLESTESEENGSFTQVKPLKMKISNINGEKLWY